MIKLWNNTPGYCEQYGQPEPYLDFYPAENSRAAIIVCAGGGYCGRAAHEGVPVALWLNSVGISAFVLSYRFAPYRYNEISGDVLRAVRLVRFNRERYSLDADKIGILGFSAGGHLASTAAVHFDHEGFYPPTDDADKESARPDAAVLCYSVISTDEKIVHQGSFKNLLGENYGKPELMTFFSNEKQIKQNTPPTFLWHTSDDPVVDVRNSLCFAAELRENQIPYELHIYPKGRHGLALEQELWTESCESWLHMVLKT